MKIVFSTCFILEKRIFYLKIFVDNWKKDNEFCIIKGEVKKTKNCFSVCPYMKNVGWKYAFLIWKTKNIRTNSWFIHASYSLRCLNTHIYQVPTFLRSKIKEGIQNVMRHAQLAVFISYGVLQIYFKINNLIRNNICFVIIPSGCLLYTMHYAKAKVIYCC